MFEYKTKGVCSKSIRFGIVDGKVSGVEFVSGCEGNLKGIARLVEGMAPSEVIERLQGIRCGQKETSCPAQLVEALRQNMEKIAG